MPQEVFVLPTGYCIHLQVLCLVPESYALSHDWQVCLRIELPTYSLRRPMSMLSMWGRVDNISSHRNPSTWHFLVCPQIIPRKVAELTLVAGCATWPPFALEYWTWHRKMRCVLSQTASEDLFIFVASCVCFWSKCSSLVSKGPHLSGVMWEAKRLCWGLLNEVPSKAAWLKGPKPTWFLI